MFMRDWDWRNNLVESQDLEWLQVPLNMIISLFHQYGLVANVAKSKATACQPGTIQYRMSEEAMRLRGTGRGETYRERFRIRTPCPN